MASTFTNNYVSAGNYEPKRNRKNTAAFGGKPDQGQADDAAEDNNQDKLFVTSMMVDPEDKRDPLPVGITGKKLLLSIAGK